MSRLNDAGYTTSGRNSTGKSSAAKKTVTKKPAPSSPVKKVSKFSATMSVPGSARPMSPADHKLVRQRSEAAKPAPLGKSMRDAHPPGPKGMSNIDRVGMMDRAKSALSVYSKGGVASRNRRNAAAKNNPYPDAVAKKMVRGMK